SSSGSLDSFEEPMQSRRLPGRVKASRGSAIKAPPRREVDEDAADDDAPAAKPKKAASGTNKITWIVAGVLSVCAMFVVGYFAFSFVSRGLSKMVAGSGGEGIPTKYLPNAPEVVVCIRVADLFGSPAGKEAMADEEIKKPVELFSKTIGLQPKDIDSVILAVA